METSKVYVSARLLRELEGSDIEPVIFLQSLIDAATEEPYMITDVEPLGEPQWELDDEAFMKEYGGTKEEICEAMQHPDHPDEYLTMDEAMSKGYTSIVDMPLARFSNN